MIPERLTALRTARHLTQREVARDLNLSRAALSAYENGRRTPSYDILMLLAAYYRTTTDYILGVREDPEQPPDLDERSREILSCYLSNDEKGRSIIYNQNLLIRDLLRYSTEH